MGLKDSRACATLQSWSPCLFIHFAFIGRCPSPAGGFFVPARTVALASRYIGPKRGLVANLDVAGRKLAPDVSLFG